MWAAYPLTASKSRWDNLLMDINRGKDLTMSNRSRQFVKPPYELQKPFCSGTQARRCRIRHMNVVTAFLYIRRCSRKARVFDSVESGAAVVAGSPL